jgi:beta-glucosidase
VPAEFTRREIVEGGAALGTAAMATTPAAAEESARPRSLAFPQGFVWGVGTSAFQIEGAVKADGRGPSIWDTYARTPGKIRNGDTPDTACDHYHRYRDDVKLLQSLGAKAYRFSIAWPRIFPRGVGRPNPKGVDFYNRLVDALLQAGIEPFPTLFHWDLPQALQDRGGWLSRDTAKAFADYAGYVVGRLGDRVKNYFTTNEFFSFIDIGHRGVEEVIDGKTVRTEFAPGLKFSDAQLYQARHVAVLAHGLSVQAIRAHGRAGTRCGPADNVGTAVPVIETAETMKAAETLTREMNAAYLTVIMEGKYTDKYLAGAGRNAPRFTPDELKAISSPVDFIGINAYRPSIYVAAADDGQLRTVPFARSHPRMLSQWQLLGPETMYWAPRLVHSLWRPKALYIAENGCAANDAISAAGTVDDTVRIMFLRSHLTELQRATAEGIPVKGCFAWSLLDNFEWSDGFSRRFGLVHVDFKTQKRTPKLSAAYFRELAARNAVV